MAEAASESDVTPVSEEKLDFDDDTLRGEKKSLYLFTREFSLSKTNNIRISFPNVAYYTCCVLGLMPPSWITNTEEGLSDSSQFTNVSSIGSTDVEEFIQGSIY